MKHKTHQTATTVIDHPDVTTLIIRGEEFIHMPTSVFLEEKSKHENSQIELYAQEIKKLREELNRYKNVVQHIRNQMKTLP